MKKVEALRGNDVGECSRSFEILPAELTAPDIMDSPAMWTIQWSWSSSSGAIGDSFWSGGLARILGVY